MSERRCGRTWCTDENPCLRCEKAKPQEGTPSARATQADQASGVPSCDSPELAAIRADDERQGLKVLPQNVRNTFVQHLMTQRRALLRMVDELTLQFNAERQAYNACGRERDDLRAKATELNLNIDGLNAEIHDLQEKLAESDTQLGWTEQKLEEEQKESQELAAKLAEAEKAHAEVVRRLGIWADRAEAAEASEKAERLRHEAAERELLRQAEAAETRVRELEARLANYELMPSYLPPTGKR